MKRAAPILRRQQLKRSKFGNKRTPVGDRTFDSKGEAARAMELRIMEKAGLILDLEFQVSFPLEVNGHLICRYKADFTYRDLRDGVGFDVVEDYKGYRTPEYALKAKLFKAIYGYAIFETGPRSRRLRT
jgi:hypothetical protein